MRTSTITAMLLTALLAACGGQFSPEEIAGKGDVLFAGFTVGAKLIHLEVEGVKYPLAVPPHVPGYLTSPYGIATAFCRLQAQAWGIAGAELYVSMDWKIDALPQCAVGPSAPGQQRVVVAFLEGLEENRVAPSVSEQRCSEIRIFTEIRCVKSFGLASAPSAL